MLMRCMVRGITSSPDPSDVFVNVWYLDSPTLNDLSALADAATPRFKDFYQALMSYFTDFVQSYEIRYYNMADLPPRVPEIRDPLISPGHDPAQGNLPEELCIVGTYHGTPPITRRRRGRLYIGPLCTTALAAVPDQPTRISTNAITAVRDRMNAFAADVRGGYWVVYSPTASEQEGLQVKTPVAGGWVDDAFDVQRRRGPDPSSRVSFSVTPP